MSAIQKLKELGESMGIKGEALHTFIKEQQAEERAARAFEREREKERTQLEQEKAKYENEKAARELERFKLELEQHSKDKQRDAEQEKLKVEEEHFRIEADLKKMQIEKGVKEGGIEGQTLHGGAKAPRMPYFDEERDCMDSYLNRFERFAELQGWKTVDRAIYLSALLKGKALDVYSRLPAESANDYNTLKAALLKRYCLSEEGFKNRFRSAKPETGESPAQFLTRLDNYLQRWIDLAKVQQTYDDLKMLIIREQYISVCPKELALFLKERAPETLENLGTLAEQFLEAHNGKTAASIEVGELRGLRGADGKRLCNKCGSPSHIAKDCKVGTTGGRSGPPTSRQSGQACFICGKKNHLARNCYHRVQAAAMETGYRKPWAQNRKFSSGNQWKGAQTNQNLGREVNKGFNQGSSIQGTGNEKWICKSHQREGCTECMQPQHVCNAMLASAMEVELKCGCKLPIIADACQMQDGKATRMPVAEGTLSGKTVSILRDTGCSTVVVRRSLVTAEQLTGQEELCVLIDGTVRRTPVAEINIESPYFTGKVKAVCMKNPLYDIIIGNVEGLTESRGTSYADQVELNRDKNSREEMDQTLAVVTRSQANIRATKPLIVAKEVDTEISKEGFEKLQKEDESLKSVWRKLQNGETEKSSEFYVNKQLLYRQKGTKGSNPVKQLVLPETLRNRVIRLAHESIMGGHQGMRRTEDRVSQSFWWPGMQGEITRFCRSCDICQRTVCKGRTGKVPLGSIPIMDTPFKRVAVDLVGPMAPVTDRGNRYLLTLVDYATRYPEAVALKNVEAETVAEAMVGIFTRVGIPAEVLSDQGSQFMSGVMKQVSRLLSLKQLTTTPYHPQCNGLVERFNGTLKTMLKRMCAEKPKDWDRYVDPLLFAYREVPQESTGFSPFELLYGRSIRGPMAILKELWTKEQDQSEIKSTYQYVIDLQERLQETCKLAQQQLIKSQARHKRYFDCKAKDRCFHAGDKVLLLLPTDANKLLMHWKGPFEVLERVGGKDYRIQLPERVRMFHANMLKRYWERDEIVKQEQVHLVGAAILEANEEEDETVVETLSDQQKETYQDVKISEKLQEKQKEEIWRLLYEYQDIFTDVPHITNLGEHKITLTSDEPIRGKAYQLPHAMRETLDKELNTMLQLGVIEPSTAPYASPVVLVKKPDGSTRVCVDYRKLNRATIFDPEPIPNVEEIFAKLAGHRYFSKFDLTKGYWQVAMREQDKDLTTFICHKGLYRFNVMPFGLVNAPATFSRVMRTLLRDSQGLDNYLDDVLAHTREWSQHLITLQDFFERVRRANLTLRPSKCEVGEVNVAFLGHQVSGDGIKPKIDTVAKILEAPRPTTKSQVRSFLGLVGFYRRFVPDCAAVAAPLTDATRKWAPNEVIWGEAQERAFVALKAQVVNPPILRLADFGRVFILQTDASNVGLGAILVQEDDEGIKHPVAFASRKLKPPETRYSTIERECLAIVWGIEKFQEYLYGKEFVLETDHQPLQYLGNTQYQNGRLMRWALSLQPYRFVIRAIHGRENVGADFLSRHPCD